MQMRKEEQGAADALHALIEYEKGSMPCESGYLTSTDKTWCRLNSEETAAALRHGVPFGFRSQWTLRQGEHAGAYSFRAVTSEAECHRLSADPDSSLLPCVNPFLPDPEKMFGYLRQLMELEAAAVEEPVMGQCLV